MSNVAIATRGLSTKARLMLIRDGVEADVPQMSAFLMELRALGKRVSPGDEAFVLSNYINGADKIKLSVAADGDEVLGFQSLKLATEGNIYGVTPGWGVIGTHIRPSSARRGVGRTLFQSSRAAAEAMGLKHIDATIGDDNPEGLAYYEAMGFRQYRTGDGVICKRYDV